ncbi:MAG TPA: tRNA (adenosine(37)-N6)-threonylcarbamoyltransferase complex dimerization subunit type 1 TsaB [Acidobacteriaceae bacterium]|nr:tRNA (adenosine(37)-N6)-threonylcarbamoyltransferase complex dimerization subunit type 1 TsaB [Acidobacteriaceae bacterium]
MDPIPYRLYPSLWMLLSIDTCGPSGSIALARLHGDTLDALAETGLAGKTYSARLVPAIAELLAAQRTSVADLAAIVVTRGPGSFTGIRIALSTAKGLAEPHDLPILAVSRLAVLAHKAGCQAAALDASRHEFYFGRYDQSTRESLLTLDAFEPEATTLGPQLAVCEPSVHALAPAAPLVDAPTATDALRFALPRLRTRDFDDPVTLDGNYLRRSDAEIFSQPGARRPSQQPQP